MIIYDPTTDIMASPDVTFGRTITYDCLIKMRENALWATEMWLPISKKMATRYYRIMNRIEQAMLNYNA